MGTASWVASQELSIPHHPPLQVFPECPWGRIPGAGTQDSRSRQVSPFTVADLSSPVRRGPPAVSLPRRQGRHHLER